MRAAVPATITAIGLALMAFMIITEGEPGALPLMLVALGAGGLVLTRRRRTPSRRG